LPAGLVNPGVAVATKALFAGCTPHPAPLLDLDALAKQASVVQLLQWLDGQSNDLEDSAIALAPIIADVLAALRALPGCRLARMSGSGSTCFALFAAASEAQGAAEILAGKYPAWWACATILGNGS
jgi:4-diphosphocytidyl-2-C-methyl-D-erythritol kinase